MKEFANLAGFAKHLASLEEKVKLAGYAGVARGAQMIEAEAKSELGHYQRANMGPFQDWAELADSTKASRSSAGFPPNNPELVSGALLASFSHEAVGNVGAAGSTSDIAVYQDQGTSGGRGMAGDATGAIPPRSIFGIAGFRTASRVAEQIGSRIVWALRGLPTRND